MAFLVKYLTNYYIKPNNQRIKIACISFQVYIEYKQKCCNAVMVLKIIRTITIDDKQLVSREPENFVLMSTRNDTSAQRQRTSSFWV